MEEYYKNIGVFMKLLKKLMLALSVLIAVGLLTGCPPGAGDDNGSDENGGNNSSSSSSSSSKKKRTVPTSSTNPYKDFNFVLFSDGEVPTTLDLSTGNPRYTYTLSQGNWKYSNIYYFTRTKYTSYYEFSVNADDSTTITKYIIIIRKTLKDDEIAKLETMSDYDFNAQYEPSSTNTESCDYYLDDHDFVTIQVYSGEDNIPSYKKSDITKSVRSEYTVKTNADSTKFLDTKGANDDTKYFLKAN